MWRKECKGDRGEYEEEEEGWGGDRQPTLTPVTAPKQEVGLYHAGTEVERKTGIQKSFKWCPQDEMIYMSQACRISRV